MPLEKPCEQSLEEELWGVKIRAAAIRKGGGRARGVRPTGPLKHCTGPLKPMNNFFFKRRIGDYVQKQGLEEGFNLIYVGTIFLGGIFI